VSVRVSVPASYVLKSSVQDSRPYDLSLDVEKKNIREHSGVLLVAYGGSRAKAPPLAARPNINVASIKILWFVLPNIDNTLGV